MIRSVKTSDAPAICAIYNYYIENTLVTFEEDSLETSAILQRINTVTTKYPWLVFEHEGIVLGTFTKCFPFWIVCYLKAIELI